MATAIQIERMTAADIGITAAEDSPEARELIADIDAYLSIFAKPDIMEGLKGGPFQSGKCLKCGAPQGGLLGVFQWGYANGEGNCAKCGWPARAIHRIKSRDGKELFSRPFESILQYHPDEITPAPQSSPIAADGE